MATFKECTLRSTRQASTNARGAPGTLWKLAARLLGGGDAQKHKSTPYNRVGAPQRSVHLYVSYKPVLALWISIPIIRAASASSSFPGPTPCKLLQNSTKLTHSLTHITHQSYTHHTHAPLPPKCSNNLILVLTHAHTDPRPVMMYTPSLPTLLPLSWVVLALTSRCILAVLTLFCVNDSNLGDGGAQYIPNGLGQDGVTHTLNKFNSSN
jgi:hypothetical protein